MPRDLLLLCALVVAAALVVGGVAMWSTPSAMITAGVAVGGLAVLTLAGGDDQGGPT